MTRRSRTIGLKLLVFVFAAAGCGTKLETKTGTDPTTDLKRALTVYASPTCSCCGEYVAYLRAEGFEVTEVKRTDMDRIKREQGIPASVQSCHTGVLGDYFVEGHVPVQAIERVIDERPDIDGIALPGMPPGSPGMGGEATEALQIMSIDGDAIEVFKVMTPEG